MRRNELTIVLSLIVIGLIAAFWLVMLSPKRDQATSLKHDVDQLHSQLEQAQQAAAAGAQEQKSFPVDYRKLVVLGKAVPEDGDQASLLVQLQRLADRSGVGFQSIDLSDAAASATPAPAPARPRPPPPGPPPHRRAPRARAPQAPARRATPLPPRPPRARRRVRPPV